jgi:phospholipase C
VREATYSRQEFLRLAAAGALAGTGAGLAGLGGAEAAALPRPARSGIEHIVVVMMENRSFDHMLGWMPGVDGLQAGAVYADAAGVPHPTWPLTGDTQGCAHPGPDHSFEGGRVALNGGACDGWLRIPTNDPYAIGYYGRDDLAFLGAAAPYWTTCDRWFSAIMAETFPNRIYMHAGQTDRIHNSFKISRLPTIWDRLAAAGVSHRYYFSDVPFLALWGSRYIKVSRPFPRFLEACRRGRLPHVSFVDPRMIGEDQGVSNDDHPHGDVRAGEAFLNRIYRAVTNSPDWESTVLVVTYDEWGGFYDHVAPGRAPIPAADRAAGNVDGLLGFRVPALVISPFAPRHTVSHLTLDHTSILRMIEWRWGLRPLTARDAGAANLARVLDLHAPKRRAPAFSVRSSDFSPPCKATPPAEEPDKFAALAQIALRHGWKLP